MMDLQRADRTTPPLDDQALVEECRTIAGWLDAASADPPLGVLSDLGRIERATARLRDGLITRLRAAPGTEGTARPRAALAQINVALSLINGAEYPVGKLERRFLGEASAVLRDIAAE